MQSIQTILINISHDYNVVINPYSSHHSPMKLIVLRLNTVNKPSPMSEGVAEIWTNSQPCKGIKTRTRHTQARRAPKVATIHDKAKETTRADLTLVHIFHAYALVNTPWVAHALSRCTPVRYGKIASVSVTHDVTQFGDFICLVCVSTVQMLVHHGSTDAGLNRHRQGLPPLSYEYLIRPLPFFPIQYSPLSPNCPARSPIMPPIWSSY
jgi:hypothetical protein